VHSGTIERTRLSRALEGGDDIVLTLVSAPAGYGKTIAVRAWLESRRTAFVWVTLDAVDDNPRRLWTYVATAVDRRAAAIPIGQPTPSPDLQVVCDTESSRVIGGAVLSRSLAQSGLHAGSLYVRFT
jgi:hypothetical protein